MAKHNRSSSHILNAASNLLGICFIVLTSLKLLNQSQKTVIDEITITAIVSFMTSCILSFLAIKTADQTRSERLENMAEIIFFTGLCILFATTLLFSFNAIR
ncbi:MAG TPA: hypothetical protein PLA61_14780 [Ferruginibacter sp.]|jgi:hypothetical protein|nr:hypothetical protein [Chitinophagales bacterium]HNF03251.1 hypothetical protein [Ferruginibacter sp.]HQR02114.1 hypothetical protein [Ferruginibacter sp.]